MRVELFTQFLTHEEKLSYYFLGRSTYLTNQTNCETQIHS